MIFIKLTPPPGGRPGSFRAAPVPNPTGSFQRSAFKLILVLWLTLLVFPLWPNTPVAAGEESESQLALKAALIELKNEFETRTSQTKDPEKLILEGLRTTAQAWALAAEFLADKIGDEVIKEEMIQSRAGFEKAWSANSQIENRMLATSELYYKAVAAVAALSAKEQNNPLGLAHLESMAGEVKTELESSVYAQRKATVYINGLALGIMPVLVKLKAGPDTQNLLDQETSVALRETEALAARTDVHLRGKFFLLYSSSVRLLLKSSFLLAEDPNLGLTKELAPIKEVWQNAGADQNDPGGLAVTMGALTLTSLPLAYGLASQ